MKTNKIAAGLFIGLTLFAGNACNEENLNLSPLSQTEASYFQEEIDFERATLGVYAKLTDFYWFNNNSPIHAFWNLPGDDVTTSGTDAFEIFSNLQPSDGRLNHFYRTAYQGVNRSNILLEKLETVADGIYVTPNLREYHQGEALFMRGYMYFLLWNYFGTSPLVTQRIQTTDQTTQPGTQGTALLDQAITDLQQAAGLLPASWSAANRGRATKSSANGMLGKALVFRGTVTKSAADHQAAIAAFNQITDRALVENYADNFSAFTENNEESLFEFQASQPIFDNVWLPNDFDNAIGSISAYWGHFDNHWSLFGAPPHVATQKLAAAFEAGDPRKEITLNPEDNSIRKYVTDNQFSQSGVGSVNNPRILRYADVLLLKAEALVQSGGSTSEAIELVNQVRTRARNMNPGGAAPANHSTAETSPTVVMDWIRNERFLEFAAEGHRWLDLRRWHLGEQINLANWNFSSVRDDVAFDVTRHLYYPIPLAELDLNPNVQQNPGY